MPTRVNVFPCSHVRTHAGPCTRALAHTQSGTQARARTSACALSLSRSMRALALTLNARSRSHVHARSQRPTASILTQMKTCMCCTCLQCIICRRSHAHPNSIAGTHIRPVFLLQHGLQPSTNYTTLPLSPFALGQNSRFIQENTHTHLLPSYHATLTLNVCKAYVRRVPLSSFTNCFTFLTRLPPHISIELSVTLTSSVTLSLLARSLVRSLLSRTPAPCAPSLPLLSRALPHSHSSPVRSLTPTPLSLPLSLSHTRTHKHIHTRTHTSVPRAHHQKGHPRLDRRAACDNPRQNDSKA
eukprot:724291-Pleurochrysis_carterae.AAC.1